MSDRDPVRIQKPAALTAISYDESGVIEASAGTGKTYTIEHMVVDLIVERSIPISRILVVTFTERATAELVGRVRGILRTMLEASEDDVEHKDAPAWVIGPEERRNLRKALLSFDRAPVYTIHGFCNRVLSEHAFQNQRPFEQNLVDREELFDRVFPRAVRERFAVDEEYRKILHAFLQQNDLDRLETLLKQSVGTWEEIRPQLSNRELSRIERDLEGFIDSFDRFREQVEAALDRGEIHGNSEPKVRRVLEAFERAVDSQRTDGEVNMWGFLGSLERVSGNDDPLGYFLNDKGDEDWMPRSIHDGLGLLHEKELSVDVPVVNQFKDEVEARLEAEKNDRGEYTYDDMLRVVKEGLEGPSADELIKTLRAEFDYAIIDEFQDTDPIQWAIFESVFYKSGSDNPCYLIGDPKQAIYGFRGADVRTYRRVRDSVAADRGGGNVIRLGTNYRSTPELVEAYNAILKPDEAGRFFDPEGDNAYESPVEAGFGKKWFGRSEDRPAAALVVSRLNRQNGINAGTYRRMLGRHYAREIRSILEDEPRLKLSNQDGEEPECIRAGDIHVLVTTQREADLVARYLREENIPHAFYKQSGLFQSDEARHLLHVLRACLSPRDRSRRLTAWKTPFFDVSLSDLEPVDRAVDEDHPLVRRLMDWNNLAESGRFGKLLDSVFHESGILRRSMYRFPNRRAVTNYQQLAQKMLDWWRNESLSPEESTARLGRFVREEQQPGEEEDDTMHRESDQEAVQIMTMHKAKGLEAPVVFVYGGWSSGNRTVHSFYPEDSSTRVKYFGSKSGSPYEARIDQYEREENERLNYVAMTRAEGRLYLPYVRPGDRSNRRGIVDPIMERLDDFLDVPGASSGSSLPESARVRDVDVEASVPAPVEPREPDGRELPEDEDPIDDWSGVDFGSLRADRRLYIESYSSVSRLLESDEEPEQRTEWLEKQPFLQPERPSERDLPSGRTFGLFFHELLEELEFDRVRRLREDGGLSDFRKDHEIRRRVEPLLAKYSIDPSHRDRSLELAWNTLIRPVRVGERQLDGICTVSRVRKELEFWLPIPEADHRSLLDLDEGKPDGVTGERPLPFRVERGYLRGFIDLVFEWDDRLYVADWKTDSFPEPEDYSAGSLQEVVDERYGVQNVFYTLALARLIARSRYRLRDQFGGLFYFFVRGMDRSYREGRPESSDGVYFSRPEPTELDELTDRADDLLTEAIRSRKESIRHEP